VSRQPLCLKRVAYGGLFIAACLAGSASSGTVACAEAEGSTTLFKRLQGTVSAVNSQGIAVEHERTKTASSEMYFPFDPQVKLQGVRAVKEIQPGDTVLVEYRETRLKDEQGKCTRSARVAVRVALVSRVPQQLPEQGLAAETEDTTDGR